MMPPNVHLAGAAVLLTAFAHDAITLRERLTPAAQIAVCAL